MSQIELPSLQECKDRFTQFGQCEHHYKEWIKPYGMETQVKTCVVCAKTFEKKYPTQAEQIKAEINKCLDYGMTNKNEIYTKVVDSLEVPRPTVRRVARDLIIEMNHKVQILKSDLPTTNIGRRSEID